MFIGRLHTLYSGEYKFEIFSGKNKKKLLEIRYTLPVTGELNI